MLTIHELAEKSIARHRFRNAVFSMLSELSIGDPEFRDYICIIGMDDVIEYALGPTPENEMVEMLKAGILAYAGNDRTKALRLLEKISNLI